jgi:hypothetical protein
VANALIVQIILQGEHTITRESCSEVDRTFLWASKTTRDCCSRDQEKFMEMWSTREQIKSSPYSSKQGQANESKKTPQKKSK